MAPFKDTGGSESSIPTLPLNGSGAGEPQFVIPMRNAMAATSQHSHRQQSDSILSQAFTEATQLNANGAIFDPSSEHSPSYLTTMSTNSANVSPELMSVSMSMSRQHPSTSMANSAALQQQRISPGSSSNMSSSPPVLANFNSVGETMSQAQFNAVHQPILHDGRGVLGNGGHQPILHDGRGVLGNGRVPATKRDGRKLFVGGLPNEGKLTRARLPISKDITLFDANTSNGGVFQQ